MDLCRLSRLSNNEELKYMFYLEKRQVIALLKYPKYFFYILQSERVYLGGLGIVCISTNIVMKIRIQKRIKKVLEEEKQRGFLLIATLEDERDKFKKINKRDAYIQNNILYLERINGYSLGHYIDENDIENFFDFFERSIVLLLKYYRKNGFYHGDFHIENIIVTQDGYINFLDFEFQYVMELKGYEVEADILKFLFYLKIYKKEFYLKYFDVLKKLVFNYFKVERLKIAKSVMDKYLKDEINEIC